MKYRWKCSSVGIGCMRQGKKNIRFVSIHIYNVFKFHAKKNRGCDPKVSTGIRNTLFYPRINISVLRFNCRWVRCSISIVNVGNDILACSSTMVSSEKNILAWPNITRITSINNFDPHLVGLGCSNLWNVQMIGTVLTASWPSWHVADPDEPFHKFRASDSVDRRIWCSSGTLCDGF